MRQFINIYTIMQLDCVMGPLKHLNSYSQENNINCSYFSSLPQDIQLLGL